MKRLVSCLLAASVLTGTAALAQGELNYTASDPIRYPNGIYAGEVAGVATNSKGHLFVFQRAGNPYSALGGSRIFVHGQDQLLEFDQTGKFVREIGKGNYSSLVANSVRVDAHDNVWTADKYSGMVIKFSPDGSQILMLLGRKPESINVTIAGGAGRGAAGGRGAGGGEGAAPAAAGAAPAGGRAAAPAPAAGGRGRGGPPGAGASQDLFTGATDVAWDASGNVFVSDGFGGNNRVAKFTSEGVFVASFGKTGSDNDSLDSPRSIATDAMGNVYVADHNNHRVQVLSNDLKSVVRTIIGVGDPWAVCISPGAHPYLYVSNSNPMNDLDKGGEIYRVELSGTVVGHFGQAGKAPNQFATVNQLDCRQANTLYTAEAGGYRVQKVKLQ